MDRYENLGKIVGEGSYGVVFKARSRQTGQLVAIKKFKDSFDVEAVRKTSVREIRVLKQLRHDNIVCLHEVFRRKNRIYLVFEYVQRSVLEDLEMNTQGLDPNDVKMYMFQVFRALQYCHLQQIIHRDIKPENLLISHNGVVKLCDFGFARSISQAGGKCTDYVATRWYRCPELLIGDGEYGKAVDIWAAGCMFAELLCGQPLFPGESDIDTLHLIIQMLGPLPDYFRELFAKNPLYTGTLLPEINTSEVESLENRLFFVDKLAIEVIKKCLSYNPDDRCDCSDILKMPYFSPSFLAKFEKDFEIALENDRLIMESEIAEYMMSNSEMVPSAPSSPRNQPSTPTQRSNQAAVISNQDVFYRQASIVSNAVAMSSSPSQISIVPNQHNVPSISLQFFLPRQGAAPAAFIPSNYKDFSKPKIRKDKVLFQIAFFPIRKNQRLKAIFLMEIQLLPETCSVLI